MQSSSGATLRGAANMGELLRRRSHLGADRPAYYVREALGWKAVSWGEVDRRVDALAAALLARGIGPQEKIAILGATRLEWALCDLAALRCGAVSVGIYPTLTPAQISEILGHAQARLLFVDTPEQLERARGLFDQLTDLETLVLWDGEAPEGVLSLAALEAEGQRQLEADPAPLQHAAEAVGPDDPANLVFTSGTTGQPKAAVLSHHNILWQAQALDFTAADDVTIAVLPMAHVGERCCGHYHRVYSGAAAAFVPDFNDVMTALAEIRPHYFGCVPRLFEKVHERLRERLRTAPPWRRRLADWALSVGRRYRATSRPGAVLALQYRLADRLVLARLRGVFGSRIRECVAGGAALDPAILAFFDAAGLLIRECYGQSETAGFVTCQPRRGYRLGTVGRALPGMAVRTAADGELELRGKQVFSGYYRDPEQTRAAFTEDGWLKTGDLAEIDAQGFVRLVGRKKEILITAGGKNVAPVPIEQLLEGHPLVEQAMVYGDRRRYLTALVAISPEAVREWAAGRGMQQADYDTLIACEALRATLREHVEAVNRQLARYETVKDFAILPRPLSVEQDELTPTMKLKRPLIDRRFGHLAAALYGE